MDEAELDRLIEEDERKKAGLSLNPPISVAFTGQTAVKPISSATQTMGAFNELLGAMTAMENYKAVLMANEHRREAAIEARIRAELESRAVSAVGEEMDPTTKMAVEFLIDIFKRSVAATPAAPQLIPPVPGAPGIDVKPDYVKAPEPPKVEEMSKTFSQQEADATAMLIYKRFPADVLAAQAGQIPRDAAIARIKMGGATQEQAEKIYQSIIEIDWSEQEVTK